jgi:hypothetical protein
MPLPHLQHKQQQQHWQWQQMDQEDGLCPLSPMRYQQQKTEVCLLKQGQRKGWSYCQQ